MKMFVVAAVCAAATPSAASAAGQHEGHQSMPHDMAAPPPAPAAPPGGDAMAMPMSMPGMPPEHFAMKAALGSYPSTREASGTAWQPEASRHQGVHGSAGSWMVMGHALLNTVYDWQERPRGNEKLFVSGMAMGSARRDFADGSSLQLRAMVSPDPLMGKRGYPLLLAAGETADGVSPLVDRQHPHEFFMELSASYSLRLGSDASLFVYGGLPGEPAFGPPAFMHRLSILDSPEAPITHHWLDSTHVAFGVVTAGLVAGKLKLEASRFNGREPDQHRWNIETGPLDSSALRLSWNPTPNLALQGSWGRFVSPEQLEPGENQTRWSASLLHTLPIGDDGYWSSTLAWGRRSANGRQLDAVALESALRRGRLTVFARAERTENDELSSVGGHHGPAYRVGKVSLGFVRDLPMARHLAVGAGALASLNFVPGRLEGLYGRRPRGAMAFLRVRVD